MSPLRITWSINSHVVIPGDPIHLDALVAKGRYNEAEQAGYSPVEAIAASKDLPFRKQDGVWCASQLFFQSRATTELQPRIRRINPHETTDAIKRNEVNPGRRSVTQTNQGRDRNFLITTIIRHCSSAVAWCVGERDDIEYMLSLLPWIGKLGREGYGVVRSISIDDDPKAESLWTMRNLPASFDRSEFPNHYLSSGHTSPPYWRKSGVKQILAFPSDLPVTTA